MMNKVAGLLFIIIRKAVTLNGIRSHCRRSRHRRLSELNWRRP